MILSLTGTPGTGKTEVSKELARLLGYNYVNLNKFAEEKGLIIGYDEKRDASIVDTDKLGEAKFPNNSVVDGHLSHFVPADLVIVLRTKPDVLKKRLEEKGWSEDKIQENLEAEILGVCSVEAGEINKNVFEVNTTKKSPEQAAKTIKVIMDKKILYTKQIDWLIKYEYMLRK